MPLPVPLIELGGLTRIVYAGHGSGDEGNRTPNPRLAKAVLCQLSYVPRTERGRSPLGERSDRPQFEVASRHRSSSAREERTLEKTRAPAASATTTARSFFIDAHPACPGDGEWAQLDLNQRPRRYQRRALTN